MEIYFGNCTEVWKVNNWTISGIINFVRFDCAAPSSELHILSTVFQVRKGWLHKKANTS